MGELKQCPFCGGDGFMYNVVPNYAWWACRCASCGVETSSYNTEAEAIEAWNRRAIDLGITNRNDHFREVTKMIERTAKVIGHEYYIFADVDGSVGIIGSPRKHEWLCGDCKKKVFEGDDYCSHCGCKLIWEKND